MKKIKNSIIYLLILTVFLCGGCRSETPSEKSPSKAEKETDTTDLSDWSDENESGFSCEQIDGTLKIVAYEKDEQQVIVPQNIEGKAVTVIGNGSFYRKKMMSISLPQGLKTIEYGAFYRCYSLTEIVIPQTVTQIGGNPFFRVSSLKRISVESNNQNYCDIDGVLYNKDKTILLAYPEGKEAETFTVPASVTTLDKSAFGYRCYHLKEIVIPSTVTKMPEEEMFVFPDDITLIVESGSAAEQYAKDNSINYITQG